MEHPLDGNELEAPLLEAEDEDEEATFEATFAVPATPEPVSRPEALDVAVSTPVAEEGGTPAAGEVLALREGLVVELVHARRRYTATGDHPDLAQYIARFRPGTWCRCVVETRGDGYGGAGYTLRYEDGPYEEGSYGLHRTRGLPKPCRFLNVPAACVRVDYESAYTVVTREGRHVPSHAVYVVPLIVATQLFLYFFYAIRSGSALEMYSPMGGPPDWELAETAPFPGCADLRRTQWWRFWTYQWVHEGWAHVGSNALLELVFGIPLEVAHGAFRTGLVLQVGVAAGALSCAVFDVQRNVVGASGGCYALLGAHIAVMVVHWRRMRRGILNRATKVGLFSALAFADVFSTVDRAANVGADKAAAVSYSAHVGGLAVGLLLGICVLQQKPVAFAEIGLRRRGAAAVVLAFLLVGAIAWISVHDPPKDLPWLYPDSNTWAHRTCCAKLDGCAGLDPDKAARLVCRDRTSLVFHFKEATSCANLRAMLDPDAAS